MKNNPNETCSSNLVFLRENNFQRDSVAISPQKLTFNFENAWMDNLPIQSYPNFNFHVETLNTDSTVKSEFFKISKEQTKLKKVIKLIEMGS